MSSKSKKVVLLTAAGAAAAVAAAIWTGKLPVTKRPGETAALEAKKELLALAPTVSVVRAATEDFVETVVLTGTVVPREEILVGPEVEGLRIVEVLADEGEAVKKGQVLARLVSDTLEAQLAQNKATRARAEASIAQATSNIASAEARQVEARNALERGKPLRQSGYMSEATLDQRESAARTASAQLAASKDALKLAEAELAQAQAAGRELEWRRSRTEIAAPADGIISRRVARVGGFAAGAGDALFRIVARGEIELEAEVPETRLSRLKEDQKAEIQVAGGATAAGKVRIVSPEIDRQTRLGRTRIFIGQSDTIRVGAFARASVETARSRGISVPSGALQHAENGTTSVLAVLDGVVRARPVKVGLVAGARTEIVEGLTAGEMVVARSGTFLRDGDVVKPVLETTQVSEVRQ
jgi:RND family efflux transporter MFP subunit